MDVLAGRGRARRLTVSATALAVALLPTASAASPWTVSLNAGSKGQGKARTLSAPTGVTATCSPGGLTPIVVTWTAVSNAASYTVYKSAGGGAYASAMTVSAPTTTWSYSPPALLQTYSFKVTVTIGSNWVSGLSSASATRTITVLLLCS